MAFFKFRQSNASPAKTSPRTAEAAASAATETVDNLRRRARHRLIGAVVLVLAAVIGFPLLFDTQPRPVAINAPITIPDRDSAAPLAAPKRADVATPASLGEREEVLPPVAQAVSADAPKPAAVSAVAPKPAAVSAAAAKPASASAAAPASAHRDDPSKAQHEAEAKARREADARKQREDAARARAALAASSSAKPAASAPAGDVGRFIVQIGAFAEADKVQEARHKAERVGLKTYTQVVDTKDGKRTRVRVGPFASRAEAEKAADALKKAGLAGGIFSL